MGKNYLILERLVGETFMNQWKNIYPCLVILKKIKKFLFSGLFLGKFLKENLTISQKVKGN